MIDPFVIYIIVIVFFLVFVCVIAYNEMTTRTIYMEKSLEYFDSISKSLDKIASLSQSRVYHHSE